MMGENKVSTPTMDIKSCPQIFQGHGRAFNVPTWAPLTPRTFPCWFSWLCTFPKCKIHRMMFSFVHLNPGPGLHIFKRSARQLPLVGKLVHRKVNIDPHLVPQP